MAPMPSSPPTPPSSPTRAPEGLTTPRRLPRVEDFPETGPNALATFQQRVFARVVDELIVIFPFSLVLQTLRGLAEARGGGDTEPNYLLALVAGALVLQVLYEVIAVAVWGRTLGKWLFGVRVARYTDGARPTWTQSTLRCLLWAAPDAAGVALFGVLSVGALPVFLSAFRRPLRRGWHDEAGGTIVVRTR
jgi:uncharacterized RDD family membrane protein YckC